MEESRKGSAPGSSTKNSNASFDEDFGEDFLDSWKPSKFGKDSMDFDVEPIGGKNNKFKFGKMDDFDLGEDFGKLPSFKMDFDFPSPVKKSGSKPSNENASKESFLGKKGKEKSNFSSNFDFDDDFGINMDSEVSKEKKNTQAQPTASITSSEQNKSKSQNHFGKFDLESEVSKEKKNTQAQPTTSFTSSDQNTTKNKTQIQNTNMEIDPTNNNTLNNDIPTSKITSKPDTSKSHNSAENISKQQSDNLSNTSASSQKRNQETRSKEFSLPSVSGNNSSTSRRFRDVFDKFEKQERENANSVQSIGSSSHSRSESPVVSSANREEIKEKDGENQNNLGKIRSSDSDKSLSNIAFPPPIHRNSTSVKEKLSASLLYKPQQTSILATKQSSDITNKKIEGINLLSSELRRDSKKSEEQNEIPKAGLLNTVEKPSTKGPSVGTGNNRIETENRTFSILRSNTNSSLLTNIGLMREEKQTLVSRLVKLNPRSPTPNPTISQDKDLMKSLKFSSERNNKASLSPQNKTPPVPLFLSKEKEREKPSFLSPSLKRKLSEEPGSDPFIHNPLKRISSNSPVETRKSPDIIPMSPRMITANESPVTTNYNLLSPNILPDLEMPVFLENNSNVEKAEKISKDLDDICSMLKKRKEEAKELLVRAVVNNNKLLMLNHPMYDEKLRALEGFSATLHAKHLVS